MGRNSAETLFYKSFLHDQTRTFMPKFYREVEYNDECEFYKILF